MEDTILTYDEFIGLDPELTLLLANELVVRVDPPHPGHEPAWRYRINPDDGLMSHSYVDASAAAYARYREMSGIYAVDGDYKVHRTVKTFAEATGLSTSMIQAHGITQFNSASGVPLHILREGDDGAQRLAQRDGEEGDWQQMTPGRGKEGA